MAEHQGNIVAYEHTALEYVGSDPLGGSDYIDPAQVIADAREEAERKVQEAYAEGLRRGMAAGEEKFNEKVGEAAQVLHNASQALQEARQAFLASVEPQVVALAGTITRRILEREAKISEDVVTTVTRAALELLLDQEHLSLRVNPADLEVIRARRITLLEEFENIKRLDIVPDDQIELGGCIAESHRLHVDAQLSLQVEQVMGQLEA